LYQNVPILLNYDLFLTFLGFKLNENGTRISVKYRWSRSRSKPQISARTRTRFSHFNSSTTVKCCNIIHFSHCSRKKLSRKQGSSKDMDMKFQNDNIDFISSWYQLEWQFYPSPVFGGGCAKSALHENLECCNIIHPSSFRISRGSTKKFRNKILRHD